MFNTSLKDALEESGAAEWFGGSRPLCTKRGHRRKSGAESHRDSVLRAGDRYRKAGEPAPVLMVYKCTREECSLAPWHVRKERPQ